MYTTSSWKFWKNFTYKNVGDGKCEAKRGVQESDKTFWTEKCEGWNVNFITKSTMYSMISIAKYFGFTHLRLYLP